MAGCWPVTQLLFNSFPMRLRLGPSSPKHRLVAGGRLGSVKVKGKSRRRDREKSRRRDRQKPAFVEVAPAAGPAARRCAAGPPTSRSDPGRGGRRAGTRRLALRPGRGLELELREELGEHEELVAARAGASQAQVPVPEVAFRASAFAQVTLLAGRAFVHTGRGEPRSPAELRRHCVEIDDGLVTRAMSTHAAGAGAETGTPRGQRASADGADPPAAGAVTGTVTNGVHDLPRRRLASFSR